jgi:hypothetical protein
VWLSFVLPSVVLYDVSTPRPLPLQLVYLPEAADFIAPITSALALTVPLSESPFVAGVREQARASSVWVGVGVHETVRYPGASLLISDIK